MNQIPEADESENNYYNEEPFEEDMYDDDNFIENGHGSNLLVEDQYYGEEDEDEDEGEEDYGEEDYEEDDGSRSNTMNKVDFDNLLKAKMDEARKQQMMIGMID